MVEPYSEPMHALPRKVADRPVGTSCHSLRGLHDSFANRRPEGGATELAPAINITSPHRLSAALENWTVAVVEK